MGRLPGDRFARLLEHLDVCSECQERAQNIEGVDDSLVAAIASPPALDPHAGEADCVAALRSSSQRPQHAAETSTPPVEQLGAYRLIRPLGCGGMGAVFLARHTRLRRQCAVKLLHRDRGYDAGWRERFDREMAAIAALDDPHVVAASDAGESEGWHFLVMEYLGGLDLSRLAGRLGPLTVADACELVRQSAVGLAHVHSAGLVHRDIKPSNLMLTREGVVKILDLGLVLSDRDPLPANDRLTTVGQLMGTLAYMAPEQLADSTAVDHRADLYSLGATLFRLLAGAPPHGSARGIAPLVLAKTRDPIPNLGEYRSDVPEPLGQLLKGLLDRDPSQRPPTADAVADALQPFAKGADPQQVIATARRKRPTAEESADGPALPLLAVGDNHATPPRTPWNWKKSLAAAAALPFLILAGVTLVIITDRGQLVIESEASGLDLAIEQGNQVVEQLELSTGENRVTLRSGTYTVTMDAASDGLQLSDHTATVTRGDQTVLRVRREPITTESSDSVDDESGPRYQGKTFNHWLTVLKTERNVKTVIDAMQAVVALSKGEDTSEEASIVADQRLQDQAAAAMLQAARRYGGMTANYPGSEQFGLQSASRDFMGHLLSFYPALLPHPGLSEISSELTVGNEKSSMAAIWLLINYVNEASYGKLYTPAFGEFEKWSESEAGRAKLREFSDHLDQTVERLGGYTSPAAESEISSTAIRSASRAVDIAYQLRLHINQLLGINSFEDLAVSKRLRQSFQDAANQSQRLFEKMEQPRSGSAAFELTKTLSRWEMTSDLSDLDSDLTAWAVVPSLLQTYFPDPQTPFGLLQRLGKEAPVATADAALTLLEQRGVAASRTGMGGGPVTGGVGLGGGHSTRQRRCGQSGLDRACSRVRRPLNEQTQSGP